MGRMNSAYVKQNVSNCGLSGENGLKLYLGQRSSGVEQRFRNSRAGVPIYTVRYE